MRTIFTFIIISLLPIFSFAQTAGDFQSFQNGNWNSTSTWSRYDGTNWVNPAPNTPTNADGVITILNGHTVTVTASVTTDQTIIASGGTLTLNASTTLTVADGTGDDLTLNGTLTLGDDGFFNGSTVNVNGQFVNAGTININNSVLSTFNFQANSKYQHAQDGGNVPTANWNTTSTCEITGIVSNPVGQLGQSFGDLIWNSSGQTSTISLGLSGVNNLITGSFKIQDTGGQVIVFSTSSNTKLTINGNLEVTGASRFAITTNIAGITAEVKGNYTNSSTGQCFISAGDGSGSPTGVLNVKGDFTQSAGTLVGFKDSMVEFAGSTVQTFTSGGTFTNVNFTVKSGAILDLGTSIISGGGTLDVSGELRVGSTDANGAIQASPATAGNIQNTGTRTFNSGCTIVYNGTSAQVIGNGFPTTSGVNLTVNNSNGVSMNGDLTVGGTLNLQSGDLTIGTNTLTLNGTEAGTGALVGGDNSSLIIGGSGTFGTLRFSTGTLKDFSINRTSSGIVTLANDLTVKGTFTTTEGTLEIDDITLTLSGPIAGGSAELSTNGESSVIVDATGAITGNLNFVSDDNLGMLTLDRSSDTLETTSTVVIDSLNLTSGTFNNSSSLVISPGGYIVRSGGSMTTTPGVTQPYNVVYTGATDLTTGNELPSSTSYLNALAVKGSATFTLNKPITINGGAYFLAGTFATGNNDITVNGNWLVNGGTVTCGTNTITMKGDNWTVNAGNFNPGSGKVVFSDTDTIKGTGSLDFNDLEISGTANVTLPSGTIYIASDYQATSGAVVNPNGGTIELDGSSNQIIAAGGTNLYNVNINKSGGNVTIQNLLNLYGTLDVKTATTVSSGGNLTLISTSDAGGHDARIATLPSGAHVTGDVTIQRYMSGEGKKVWRHMSPPVTGATVADWQDFFPISGKFSGRSENVPFPDNPSLYYYDETVTGSVDNGWVAYPTTSNTESLSSGTGYAAFIRETTDPINLSLSGPINEGDFTFSVSYTSSGSASDDGWNFVSNPYPSQIDWDPTGAWTKTNIGGTIAVKDNGLGSYRYWNGSTGGLANGRIAIGQGFWVHASGSNPALVVKETAKVGDSSPFYRIEALTNHIKLALTINDTTDYTFIHFREDATDEFDWDYDGYKLKNDIQDLYTIIDDSIKLAINSLEKVRYIEKTIPIGISNVHQGNYTLTIYDLNSFEGPYIFKLIDHFTDETIDIPADSAFTYAVNITDDPASYGDARLELEINAIITGLEDEDTDLINIYPNPSSGIFNYKLKSKDYIEEAILMDMKGSIIKMFNFAGQKRTKKGTFDLSTQKKGLYLLRIKLGSDVVVKKLAIE